MRKRRRTSWGPIVVLLSVGLAVTATIGATDQNIVPVSDAGTAQQAISADQIKPDECASVSVTNRVSGSGTVVGTAANDLMTGSSGPDVMTGLAGSDCILGYDGADEIDGGPGTDVCVGGPGNDTFIACETEIDG